MARCKLGGLGMLARCKFAGSLGLLARCKLRGLRLAGQVQAWGASASWPGSSKALVKKPTVEVLHWLSGAGMRVSMVKQPSVALLAIPSGCSRGHHTWKPDRREERE